MLHPLVQELLKFWEGVNINIVASCKSVKVRCALLCVACDIPASRKVCGFLSHSANYGCSKCLKNFQAQLVQKTTQDLFDPLGQSEPLMSIEKRLV